MCGICGFTGCLPDGKNILERMKNAIRHRGPDSEGSYQDEGISMGFRRLSLVDLQHGEQPMYNKKTGLVLTFNGEIYNHQELREILQEKGFQFASQSDTEVILHGYEAWGTDLLSKLRGMFAFVIWDKEKQVLFGARDPFGIKPLYYTVQKNQLIYGSEIKAILQHPNVPKQVNQEALENYLTFQYSVLQETFFRGIYKLPPAHFFYFQNGLLQCKQYWEQRFEPDNTKTLNQYVAEIEAAMQDSVHAHAQADVEVGAFLSSGVDSSYIAALYPGSKTFTVGFDYEQYNERSYAEALSDELHLHNSSQTISPEDYWDSLPKIQYYMDEPLADPAAVALYFVSQTASKQVKAALSGEGADELFGGYNIYHEPQALRPLTRLPDSARELIGNIGRMLPKMKGKNYLIRGSKDLPQRFIGNAFIFTEEERHRLLKQETVHYTHEQITRPYYRKSVLLDEITQMQYLDISLWLVGDILLKADKMSMANSLEVRVPFLDQKVFEVARHLPTRFRVTRKQTKYALRQAARKHLPEQVAAKKKLGFPVPIRVWLREEPYYQRVKAAFLSETAQQYFCTQELIRYLDEHKSGKADNSRKIWTIYCFLIWHKVFFE